MGRSPLSSNRIALSPNESYPQHIVTAVIVAHDGAAWLPHVADALLGQTRPVQRVVAVDTGSRDRSGAVLASKFGQPAVFGMDRSTGYGTAIARALHHRAANVPVPRPVGGQAGGYGGAGGHAGGQSGDRIEWLWLLHDDCEPAPDALEQLLRGTAETSAAAVLGPKVKDWANREVILEAGLTLDTATRRVTGIEPREVDQGQHDGDRDALAVSSAGMLVRRDIWEQLGGFDPAMSLFMDDIDFCWRVHSAGYRVRVITDAIVYHAQAAAKHRRSISVGRRARMLDRRNGLLTLLGNLPFRQMLTTAAGNVLVSLLRITFFLLAKRLTAAVDELTALTSVLCHPFRLIGMRSARSRGRRAAYSRVRGDLPAGRSFRRLAEFAMSAMSKSQADTSGAHHASVDPTEDDSMLIDSGLGKRLLASPTLLSFIALLAVALVAGRSLLGSGPLGGGSLVPAWGGASDLWRTYLESFHPAGIGSTAPAPTWLAVLAALATLLAGKSWLAIDVILIGCVPLAGLTAMLAARKVTSSALVRIWVCVTYALLPVATGVIASGRFGTAVAFALLPLIVTQAGRMVTQSGPPAGRAAWATGLLVAVAGAFVPLLWLIATVACLLAAAVFRTTRRGMLRNLAIAALTPPVLLLPWSVTLFSHPAQLLLEAGLPQPGTPVSGLPARALLLLSPGGPGLPPYWVTAGLVGAAFAALFAGRRRRLIIAGWGVALTGMLAAVVVSHLVVQPDDGGPVVVWAGLPLALAGLGLLLAAAAGADALGRLLAGAKGWRAIGSGRGPWAALLALVACSTPVLAAAAWLTTGISGPVRPAASPIVPELVAVAAGQSRQVRTLVLRATGDHISYLLLRGPSPSLADTALTPPADAQLALNRAVSALTTPGGGQAADQERLLANFDIGFILVQAPVDRQLAVLLDNVSGLRPYSTTSGYSLWQLNTTPARIIVREPDGTVVPVRSDQVGVPAAPLPAAGGTLMLSEPAGGWSAAANGHELAGVPSPAGSWAQAFRLPSGGGTLSVGHPGLPHDLVLLFELLAFIVVAALALPGVHLAEQEALAAGDSRYSRAAARAGGGRTGSHGDGAAQADDSAGSAADLSDAAASVAAAGSAGRRAGLVAAGQAGTQRLARGARARVGRGAAGRTGRSKSGRAVTGGSGPGSSLPEDAAAAADQGRLAQAWPYAAADDPGAGASGEDRPSGAWPYAPADEPASGPSRGPYSARGDRADGGPGARSASAPGRARPYLGEPDRGQGRRDDFSATGLSGRPYDGGEAEPGGGHRVVGRSASGRSAAGDWPYPDAGAEAWPDPAPAAGRSPSGRSPAGSWPAADDDEFGGGRGPSAGSRARSGSAGAGAWPDRDSGYQDRAEPGWPGRDRPDRDRPDRDRPGRDRADRYELDRYQPDRYQPDRYEADQDRSGWERADRAAPDWESAGSADRDRLSPASRGHKAPEPRSPSGQWPHGEQDRSRDPAGSRRPGRESAADPRDKDDRERGGRRGRRGISRSARSRADRADDDRRGAARRGGRSGADWPQEEADRAARAGRWGRHGRDDGPGGTASRADDWRAAESAWPGGDDELLEPLPPLDGPAGGQRPGSAWRSADDGRDWDRYADDEGRDQRWSAPQPEFEPEYEGDSW